MGTQTRPLRCLHIEDRIDFGRMQPDDSSEYGYMALRNMADAEPVLDSLVRPTFSRRVFKQARHGAIPTRSLYCR